MARIRKVSKQLGSSVLLAVFLWAAVAGISRYSRSVAAASSDKSGYLVYVGTYTNAKSKGIYAFRMNRITGVLTTAGLAAEILSPSFLAIHPNNRFIYAVSETSRFQEKPGGSLAAFSIDRKTGKLTLLNQQSSGGAGPCFVTVDRTGRDALIANYGGGSVAVLPIRQDGSLGEATAFVQHTGSSINLQRQKQPHAHSINVDRANRFAVVADLGLDKLLSYRFDATRGALTPNDPPYATLKPGAGPRHFTFHPGGRYAYCINEMHCTITAFAYDARKGVLNEIQTISTLPGPVEAGFSTAEIRVHPSGKFLYGSNRGHNSIAVFAVDSRTGMITAVEHESTQGKTPRNFNIDPSGKWLLAANQNSDSVVIFRIDPKTGALEPSGQTVEVPTPVCVKFVPSK